MAFELAGTPPDVDFLGGDLVVLSGEAKGARLALRAVKANMVTLGVVDWAAVAKLKAGEAVRIDNSNFLAAQTFHRHQVPGPDYPVYDQFRKSDGTPMCPHRPMLLGPMFAAGAAGTVPSGKFQGKVIIVSSLLDREATPWQADWYRRRFDQLLGADAPNRYRLWYTDNALHGYNEDRVDPDRSISYLGVLQQALRDVSAWVEKGTPPPTNTSYKVVDGQIVTQATAAARHGVQAVVSLTANGSARAEVRPGQQVRLAATITVPPGTGKVRPGQMGSRRLEQVCHRCGLARATGGNGDHPDKRELRQTGGLFRHAQDRIRAQRGRRFTLRPHPESGAGAGGGTTVGLRRSPSPAEEGLTEFTPSSPWPRRRYRRAGAGRRPRALWQTAPRIARRPAA